MIHEKFQTHVTTYLEEGYSISRIEPDVIEMTKWERPPLTFLLYLLMGPIGWVALIFNWFLGYKYTVEIIDKNGTIEIATY